MTTQDNFIAETQKQIQDWQSQMAEYQKGFIKTTETQAKADFDVVVDQLEDAVSQAQAMVEQAQAVNENAWSDMELATQKAMNQLQKGWLKAMSQYQ